ncbi:hypothetical protein D9615_003858 [Tricholomella constricta]|uniref:HNH endonuclease n=1 Tax=Tricholomella constricta TaxID=117010 RepID=A0A8H5HIC2_9AGAR|nr:hypothetical protein D9615_003858 [Tricholomella constricta]
MSGDSVASFTKSVKDIIITEYRYRCVICLQYLTEGATQAAHVLDSASVGKKQLDMAVEIGFVTADYQRSSVVNGIAQCPTCHIGFFTPNDIALSPCLPVLEYIHRYIKDTPIANQIPLHQVFEFLERAMTGDVVPLPDPTPILPYLGLFSLVVLNPEVVVGRHLSTQHLPKLSILRSGRFHPAPDGTHPADEHVARIFDVMAVASANPPLSPGTIPLSATDPDFQQHRYWRVPVNLGAIFTALAVRVIMKSSECDEIIRTRAIVALLLSRATETKISRREAARPSGGGGYKGGGGSTGRGSGKGHDGSGKPGSGTAGRGRETRSLRSGDRGEPPAKRVRRKEDPHASKSLVEMPEPGLSDRSGAQSSNQIPYLLDLFDKQARQKDSIMEYIQRIGR